DRVRRRTGDLALARPHPHPGAEHPGGHELLRVHAPRRLPHARAARPLGSGGRPLPGAPRGAAPYRANAAPRGDGMKDEAPKAGARAAGPLVVARNLVKDYFLDGHPIHALRSVTLEVGGNDFVSVMGPSGCGKSTLLHLLGAVDAPTGGLLQLFGRDA